MNSLVFVVKKEFRDFIHMPGVYVPVLLLTLIPLFLPLEFAVGSYFIETARISTWLYELSFLIIFSWCWDGVKRDISSGPALFLSNCNASYTLILISKIIISVLISACICFPNYRFFIVNTKVSSIPYMTCLAALVAIISCGCALVFNKNTIPLFLSVLCPIGLVLAMGPVENRLIRFLIVLLSCVIASLFSNAAWNSKRYRVQIQ